MTDAQHGWGERLLAFETLGDGRFRSHHPLDNRAGAVFGGQPLGQALAAARLTAPGWPAHNLSATFLRAGAIDRPIDYAVETVRDGRRYAARRVVASQDGRAILDALCSFHDPEDGFAHQFVEAGDVPPPEALEDVETVIAANRDRIHPGAAAIHMAPFPIRIRLVDPERSLFGQTGEPRNCYWLRMPSAAPVAEPGAHQALIAFLSDFWLAGSAGAPHSARRGEAGFSVVSLTHAMWFHAPARADDWLLFRTESPWAGEGRGLARGFLHDRAGRLVATVVQEVSMRRR